MSRRRLSWKFKFKVSNFFIVFTFKENKTFPSRQFAWEFSICKSKFELFAFNFPSTSSEKDENIKSCQIVILAVTDFLRFWNSNRRLLFSHVFLLADCVVIWGRSRRWLDDDDKKKKNLTYRGLSRAHCEYFSDAIFRRWYKDNRFQWFSLQLFCSISLNRFIFDTSLLVIRVKPSHSHNDNFVRWKLVSYEIKSYYKLHNFFFSFTLVIEVFNIKNLRLELFHMRKTWL